MLFGHTIYCFSNLLDNRVGRVEDIEPLRIFLDDLQVKLQYKESYIIQNPKVSDNAFACTINVIAYGILSVASCRYPIFIYYFFRVRWKIFLN